MLNIFDIDVHQIYLVYVIFGQIVSFEVPILYDLRIDANVGANHLFVYIYTTEFFLINVENQRISGLQ